MNVKVSNTIEKVKQKVIAYYRVSTILQDNSRQIDEVRAYCNSHNLEIVHEIEENISGIVSWKERKLNEVFDLTGISGIVVLELSRFGRNTKDVLEGIELLQEKGIWLLSINNNLKTLDNNGEFDLTSKLITTILLGVAEMERSLTKQRTTSGLLKKISDGNWTGGKFLPYGYKRVDKKLEIDENESKVIKQIFKLYLESNFGTKKIANYLNRNKIPTRYNLVVEDQIKKPKRWKNNPDEYKKGSEFEWKDGTIYSILTNKVYIGEKEGKGKLDGFKLYSPPIIEKDVFGKVQEKLKNTQKRTSTKYIYVLEGKPKCGVCNSGYFPHKRSSNRDNTYKCLSKRYGKSCDNYGISIPKLNTAVWTTLRHNSKEIDNILEINKNKNDIEIEINYLNEKKSQVEIELSFSLKKEIELLKLYLENTFDKEILDTTHKEIKTKITSLKEELEMINSDLRNKKDFLKLQQSAKNSLRNIKDNIHILKRTFDKVIHKLVIYPVIENKIDSFFQYKKDVIVKDRKYENLIYVELFTYINSVKPLCFVISQRTNKYLFITDNIVFDKATKTLRLKEIEGEEEEIEFVYKDLIYIESLLKNDSIENNQD